MSNFKLGLCSISFRDKTPEEILIAAKEAGLSFVEWGSDVHAPKDDAEKIAEIVKLQLKDFAKRLAEQEFKLVVDDKALAQLAKDGYDPAFGARPVKRAIQRELENPIAKNIIAGKYLPGAEIKVTAKNGAIVV